MGESQLSPKLQVINVAQKKGAMGRKLREKQLSKEPYFKTFRLKVINTHDKMLKRRALGEIDAMLNIMGSSKAKARALDSPNIVPASCRFGGL